MSALHRIHRTRAEAILAVATLLLTGLIVFQPVHIALGGRAAWIVVVVPGTLCSIVLVGTGVDLIELSGTISIRSGAGDHRLARLG